MDDYAGYAGRLLADRYRLPLPPADAYELAESLAYDTASGQEVLVRQVPLPEVVEAEFVAGPWTTAGRGWRRPATVPATPGRAGLRLAGRATRRPADPAVRRAVEAAVAASACPTTPGSTRSSTSSSRRTDCGSSSELVPSRPLAALLAERPLGAHRAAEIAADLLAALRVVHAHGWTTATSPPARSSSAKTAAPC